MNLKITIALLECVFLGACQTPTTTAQRQKLSERVLAQRQSNPSASLDSVEPPPPAEGPDDVPAGVTQDPNRNPALLPSPLLRYSAASRTP